ncbi:unnamed protein product [Mytilus edulis]|uniref:Uncharacterized protein n=1 Tax=Mytilus edulis TaxID=6550 RepID=A0A8S3UGR8_MYTED|nr:unnamed protein product [Mytilus edulis]
MGKFKGLLCGVGKKKKKKDEVPDIEKEEGKPDDNCSNPNKDCKVFNINITAGNLSIAGGIIRENEEHSDSAFESGSKSAVVKDQLLTEVYTPVNETENGLIVTSSQDSGIGSEEVFPTTSKDSVTDIHACKSEIKQIDEIQDLPKNFENNKLEDSIYEEDKGDEISSINQGMNEDFQDIQAVAQCSEYTETAPKSSENSLAETVEEDGSSLSITNYNNVDKLAQFSNVSRRLSTPSSLPEGNSTSDSQLFGSHGGQENLSGLNIKERNQSSSQSVNSVLSRAANDDTDQATQEEESRSGEDDVDQDAEVYNTATPSDGKPQNSEQKDESTEKKGVDGAVVSDVINKMSDFGKDSMCKNFDIAMTPESNSEVKKKMGEEIGNTGRIVTEHMANVAIQSFRGINKLKGDILSKVISCINFFV